MKWLSLAILFGGLTLITGTRVWLGLTLLFVVLFALEQLKQKGSSEPSRPAAGEADTRTDPTVDKVVVLPLEDCLDLHAFSPSDQVDAAGEYLQSAAAGGLREVRIIHGRGTGFQRRRIRELLRQHPLVEWFGDAPPERGGWGATIVRLTPPPPNR